jgi:hypothetical protein
MSLQQRILKKVYDLSEEYHKVYNMINVAALINKLRPGCILTGIGNEGEMSIALSEVGIQVQRYKGKPDVFILVRKDRPDLLGKMSTLNSTFRNSGDNAGDEAVGEIIGYIEPSALRDITSKKPRSIGFSITIEKPPETNTIRHYPQRISSGANVDERLANYKLGLENMELPDGFTIKSVSVHNSAKIGRAHV